MGKMAWGWIIVPLIVHILSVWVDKLKEDISESIKENDWSFTPKELLNKLGLDEVAKWLYPEGKRRIRC